MEVVVMVYRQVCLASLVPFLVCLLILIPERVHGASSQTDEVAGREDLTSKERCVQALASSLRSRDIDKFKSILHPDFEMIQSDGFRLEHDEAVRATNGVFETLSKFVVNISEGKWTPVKMVGDSSCLECWETVRELHYEFTPIKGNTEVQIKDPMARIVVTAVEEKGVICYKLRVFEYLD
jgi:hypothetical protein